MVRLSPDPSLESGGGLSHSVELESLEEGGEVSRTLYIRATAPTDLRLISKAKWIENSNGGFVGGSDSVVSLAVTTPFGLSTHIRDTGGEALPSLAPLQPFVLNHTLTNLSPMPLHLHSITFSPHVSPI